MTAVLYYKNTLIRFVWGDGCDVLPGEVRMLHYEYTQIPQNYLNNTIPMDHARRYWDRLVKDGFSKTLDDYAHVPHYCRPDWDAKLV